MLDSRHLETIAQLLALLESVEPDVPRALLACEDVYVALRIGGSMGLTIHQIAQQHDRARAASRAICALSAD